MKLPDYLKKTKTSRAVFAAKINTTKNYVNNICRDPSIAGKVIVSRIIKATRGAVTYEDMWLKK